MTKPRGPFQITGSRPVYANPWIEVREDQVVRPGGTPGVFGMVTMKTGSTVVALSPGRDVYLVREFKYAVNRETTEVVSGALEAGETPLAAAKRELKEELGLEAREWVDLGVVDPFTTVIDSPNHLFLALDVREGQSSPDDGEIIRVEKVPLAKAVDMVLKSEITHGASCVALLKADAYFRGEWPKRK